MAGEQDGAPSGPLLEGIFSLLDTDLYKLTMQCCVLKYFPGVEVTYNFTNRTPHMRLNRAAFRWVQAQVDKLENLRLSKLELEYLRKTCTYLNDAYLHFMSDFQLRPSQQVKLTFTPEEDTGSDSDVGDLHLHAKGRWVDTILYEIPLLALISEAYFKFIDRDWSYNDQRERAKVKGLKLLEHECIFTEFGTRRRRDYHTQELVLQGLLQARDKAREKSWKGLLAGTSNVHFAMKFGIPPVGTVAHEWFMGVAAITNDYEHANETALGYWVATFGKGVLGVALTDTFGTPDFLKAFSKPIPAYTSAEQGLGATQASVATSSVPPATSTMSESEPPIRAPIRNRAQEQLPTYAEVFTGVRQDSGDPERFIQMMREFYDKEAIKDKKTIVFSDSLNIDLCLRYKAAAEIDGFQPTFGVGTFLTNDYVQGSTGKKSVPLNIVIKIASASGRPAIKISDNIGKNTGDRATVAEVKQRLGYQEKAWAGGDEAHRWDTGVNPKT